MSSLRTDRAALRVAVVVDRLQDSQAGLVRGIESVLHPLDMAVLVVVSHPMHPRRGGMLRRLIAGGQLHGVVVTALAESAEGCGTAPSSLQVFFSALPAAIRLAPAGASFPAFTSAFTFLRIVSLAFLSRP